MVFFIISKIQIKLLPGAISCWVYLSALEILLKCERYNDSSQMDAYSRYTIGIRAYAREKVGCKSGLKCFLSWNN